MVQWGDGFHRAPDEGQGYRNQLILLRTKHETNVFNVFTARALLITLPSRVLKAGIRLHR